MKNKEEKKLSYLISEMYDVHDSSKEYLEDWLEEDDEAKEHYPTIDEYSDAVSNLGEMLHVRIYDLALYELTQRIIEKLKTIEENK